MLHAIITFFTAIFERDPELETWPEEPRHTHLTTTQVFGTAICGGTYITD